MPDKCTSVWTHWFHKNCSTWSDADKRRYINVVNDPEEIDEVELESARELIIEINGKPPVE